FTLDIDVTLKTIRYAQAGVLWRAQPWLLVGASFRGGFVLALDQGFRIHGDLGPAGSPVVKDGFFELHSLAFDLFQPEQWAAGFALQLTPRVLVSGDVTWQRWSAYENPAARIQISYDLKQLNDIVHIVAAPPLEKAYFHDTFVPRLGVEWLAARSPHPASRRRAGAARGLARARGLRVRADPGAGAARRAQRRRQRQAHVHRGLRRVAVRRDAGPRPPVRHRRLRRGDLSAAAHAPQAVADRSGRRLH